MYTITYTITTLVPVVIAARYSDMNMVNTEQYIPATTVLGLLAQRVLAHKHISSARTLIDEHFYRWFLLGEITIGNAFIVSHEHDMTQIHFPTPFSIHHKKHNKNIIYDLLFDDDVVVDEQTRYLKGFCAIEDEQLYTKNVETKLNFHHARVRETGVSREGAIFTYEAIAKDQTFQGIITGKGDDLDTLLEICQQDKQEWFAYIGRSKNAQYGHINITFSKPKIQSQSALQPQKEISLTFLSNTIIYNEHGFPTTDPMELIKRYLPNAVLHKAMIKKTSIENFISVWRMKKPSETCFAAGSTFLLDISECDMAQLAKLELTGIGERTYEGFGQCKFGWQTRELQIAETSDEESLPPKFPMTERVKDILKILAMETFEKRAEMLALQDLSDFKKLPVSSSFVGRLQIIAKNMEPPKQWTDALEELCKRKPAREKLENCHNGKLTLLDFLKGRTAIISTILKKSENADLKKLCDDIQYVPETDRKFGITLFHAYFDTFFAVMRKRVVQQEGTI